MPGGSHFRQFFEIVYFPENSSKKNIVILQRRSVFAMSGCIALSK